MSVSVANVNQDHSEKTISRIAYSIREFCEKTGHSRVTVWRLCKDGRIPSVRVGRNYLIPAKVLAGIGDGTLVIGDQAEEGSE